jgi:hypothetical protein
MKLRKKVAVQIATIMIKLVLALSVSIMRGWKSYLIGLATIGKMKEIRINEKACSTSSHLNHLNRMCRSAIYVVSKPLAN